MNAVVAAAGAVAVHVPEVSTDPCAENDTLHACVNGPTPPDTLTVVVGVVTFALDTMLRDTEPYTGETVALSVMGAASSEDHAKCGKLPVLTHAPVI